jgi:hypothetical protein
MVLVIASSLIAEALSCSCSSSAVKLQQYELKFPFFLLLFYGVGMLLAFVICILRIEDVLRVSVLTQNPLLSCRHLHGSNLQLNDGPNITAEI